MQKSNPAAAIPPYVWGRPLGQDWENPYQVRYSSNLDDGPWHGAPLGGLGAGCLGRSPRGDFNLWHLDGGEHTFGRIAACQFSVFEQAGGQTHAYALCTEPPADGCLSTWRWYPDKAAGEDSVSWSTGSYYALYPRSWFTYERVFNAELTCEQFSPIWAANYQESSYPIAVFIWTAHNPTDQPITLSVLLTWQNLVGWFTNRLKSPEIKLRDDGSPVYDYAPRWGESQGNVNQLVGDEQRLGILLSNGREPIAPPTEGEGQWAIATLLNPLLTEVFYDTRWNPAGDGADIWQSFSQDGSLRNREEETPAAEGEQVAAAIAVRFTLKPGQTRQIPFVLAWDLPVTEFAPGIQYLRRYTDFFGRNGQNAWSMVRTALKHYPTWQQKIDEWQQSVLERPNVPPWLKPALFNELYALTQGGTLWTAATEDDPVGQFAILECLDYRWYESLDVRLYGSFALLMLFPELEKAVMRAFARAIPTEDTRTRTIGYYYTIGVESPQAVRKVAGATPHDLGAPNEHVWQQTNYTSYQDCNQWKDLPCDFVLQVYRDYLLTGADDFAFLEDCWEPIVQTLRYLKSFDQDFDGIPENSGVPDQTFDDWKLQGVSAYCGGLWIAALEAAIAIGRILASTTSSFRQASSIQQVLGEFVIYLDQARSVYHETLWNGSYYRIDSASGSEVVMADQLCGQFYARLLGLPDVVAESCTKTALRTIYQACFVRFNEYVAAGMSSAQAYTSVIAARAAETAESGRGAAAADQAPTQPNPARPFSDDSPIGAANGVLPDGSPENPNATHPLEVWIGINFGLAAFMIQMGLHDEGLEITEAVVRQIYDHGLQFRTPEAITANRTFRACHYLRPMAIWAVYGLLSGEL